jgi:hypothetical protein
MVLVLVIVGAVAFVGVLLLVTVLCRPVDDYGSEEVLENHLSAPFDDPFDTDVDW